MPAGRPPIPFDPDMADEICERIATTEMGLEQVLEERRLLGKSFVSSTTIYKWLIQNGGFAEQSARARKMQAELLHDRAQIEAQRPLIGRITKTVQKEDGTTEVTETVSDNVERSKLIVQTTLRRAGQLDAKKYGDKIEHTGEVGIKRILVPNRTQTEVSHPPESPDFE